MATIDTKCVIGREVEIGWEGENNARRLLFPIASFLTKWKNTEARMLYKRPGDFFPTPINTEMADETTIAWTITRYDVERQGVGSMYIAFIDENEDVVGMTPETLVMVKKGPARIDLNTPEEILPGWIQKVYDLLDEIPGRVETAIQAALDTGKFKGEKGDPGPTGAAGPRGPVGPPGQNGVTPTVEMERFDHGDGYTGLEITVNGDNSADTKLIFDGYSPTVTATRDGNRTELVVKDKDGERRTAIYDGSQGTGISGIWIEEVNDG